MKVLLWLLLVTSLSVAVLNAQESWQSISADTLQTWIQDGKNLEIIDVRGKSAFYSGTIQGAINAGSDPKGYLPSDHSDPIVLIIPYPVNALVTAQWIARLQHDDDQVSVLDGGIEAWLARGGELVKPENYYTRPGTVPFLIPKGLCEDGEPAQVFE